MEYSSKFDINSQQIQFAKSNFTNLMETVNDSSQNNTLDSPLRRKRINESGNYLIPDETDSDIGEAEFSHQVEESDIVDNSI